MKKLYKSSLLLLLIAFLTTSDFAFCQTDFSKALKTCEEYSQSGSAEYKNETFNITITLKKAKGNTCQYKEKIYQGKDYETLVCNFSQDQLDFMTGSMERFYKEFPKQIAKNKIFEAKLTSNGEIFQKYLINPKVCTIEQSKRK